MIAMIESGLDTSSVQNERQEEKTRRKESKMSLKQLYYMGN